jgi:glyoxylate reductase
MRKIFITRRIPDIAKELLLKQGFAVDVHPKSTLSRQELIALVKEYDGILSMLSDFFDEEILAQKERLQVISNYAVGLDNIDLESAKKMGIAVLHLPDIVTNSTADLTLALLLAFSRKICESRDYVRKGLWKEWKSDLFVGDELFGKTLGILGFGRIGQAVAKRALGFGMKILFSSLSKKELDEDLKKKCIQVTQEELFASSDVISLHVPLTPTTRGMIDLGQLRQMKKKPLLINMARGPVIKTDDLIIALKEGMIRGAALDVTDPEPLPGSHPLCSMENCWIVPHIGTATRECRWNMAKVAAENLIDYFAGC